MQRQTGADISLSKWVKHQWQTVDVCEHQQLLPAKRGTLHPGQDHAQEEAEKGGLKGD